MGIPQLADLVLETANAPGTSAFILGGAPDGRQTFADAFPDGGEVYYYASDGSQTEWGVGTLTLGSPNTLARTIVIGNLFGSKNALNFTSSVTIWNEIPAVRSQYLDDAGFLPVSPAPDFGRDIALSAKAAEARYAALDAENPQVIKTPFSLLGALIKDGLKTSIAQFQIAAEGIMRWSFGRDGSAESGTQSGNDFVISRYDNTGKVIDNPLSIERETGKVKIANADFSGSVTSPDLTEFDNEGVLNGKTAEGRYIKSVPDPSSSNKRITDIWENSDGRAVTGDGVGSNILASLADIPGRFISAPQAISQKTLYSIPHNLGRVPTVFGIHAVCNIAEAGYTVGQIADLRMCDGYNSGYCAIPCGADETNIYFGSGVSYYAVTNLITDNGYFHNITNGSWSFIFWAA